MTNISDVAVIGKYSSDDELAFFSSALRAIRANDTVEYILNFKDDIKTSYVEGDVALLDTVLDKAVDVVESADAVVLTSYNEAGIHSDNIAWLTGYCYSIGVPVIFVTGELSYKEMPCLLYRSLQAHIKGLDNLAEYDFVDMPVEFHSTEVG